MAFRINDREKQGTIEWIGEWPFPARAQFIKSNAYDTFLRELERYVRGEVQGRSFLISGHRGAGKTSLVRRAVEELNYSVIDNACRVTRTQGPDAERMLDQRRPLLVRLHGPSLVESEKPPDVAGTTGKQRPTGPLVLITIALYRALAAEYSRSYTNHARDKIYQAHSPNGNRQSAVDYLELAGQFALELDNFPQPSTLRDLYRRLDRVGAGILWPFRIGEALQKAHLNDRGVREIVALATAAQAFAICTAEVKKTETGKDSKERQDSIEFKGEATLKDVANKLLGIAAGVGVGVLTSGPLGSTAAAALGLATGAFSVLTLNWSSKRSATSERKLDYTFIIEPDKQSLERDLPLVIERVRDAGLAPVFVLDELDKVDTAVAIAGLVDRLKHLTTDYGCFCFLTDRQYYVDLIRKVEKKAFPVEHTYFSLQLFILQHPDAFLEFLQEITQPEPSTLMFTAADVAARSIFGLFVLHRSELNMVKVLREIAGLCRPDGTLKLSTADLQRSEYVLAASIQLAIGLILKGDAMRQRVFDDPSFMQWAVDALYILSRSWERKSSRVKLDRASIVHCLLQRSGKEDTEISADPTEAERMLLEIGIGGRDLDIIDQQVERLADLLCDSTRLKHELAESQQAELAELVPATNLMKRVNAGREFEFLYDMYGQEVAVAEALKTTPVVAGLPPNLRDRVGAAVQFLDDFKAALRLNDIQIADLIELPVLPATADPVELDAAHLRLSSAALNGQTYPRLSEDLALLSPLMTFVGQIGPRLATLFRLALQVAADARTNSGEPLPGLKPVIEAIARYVDLRSYFQQISSPVLDHIRGRPIDPGGAAPTENVADLSVWHANLLALRMQFKASVPADKDSLLQQAWPVWQERIMQYLTEGRTLVEPAIYADLVGATVDRAPGNVFRRDLADMSLADWSRFCLWGFPRQESAKAPAWTFAAGLCVLGFRNELVREAAKLLPQTDPTFEAQLMRVPENAEMTGHVLVMGSEGRSLAMDPLKRPVERALLALPAGDLQAYNSALGWLANHSGLSGVIDEGVE